MAPAHAAERFVEDFTGSMVFEAREAGVASTSGAHEGLGWVEVTVPAGRATFVASRDAYAPAIDARGRFVAVWLRVDDARALGGMEFRLSSDRFATNYYAFTLGRYSDPEFDLVSDGVWTRVTFGFGSARVVGEPDRGAIDSLGWYVAGSGPAPVRARWGGLSLVDAPKRGLASLTFDDGYDEHHHAARRMAEYGFAGTAYVIPSAIGQPGYLGASQVAELQQRFGWDVASHHETPFTEMDAGTLEATAIGVRRALVQRFGARASGHLAYPLGKQNDATVRAIVRKHFATARAAARGPETLPPADWHLLRVFNVLDTTTPAEIEAAARRAREHGEWLILMFHHLVEEPRNDLDYSIDDFERALRAIRASKIRVVPVSEVWEAYGLR